MTVNETHSKVQPAVLRVTKGKISSGGQGPLEGLFSCQSAPEKHLISGGPSRRAGAGPGSRETIPFSWFLLHPCPRHLPTLRETSGFMGTHQLVTSAIQNASWMMQEWVEDRGTLLSWEGPGAPTPIPMF